MKTRVRKFWGPATILLTLATVFAVYARPFASFSYQVNTVGQQLTCIMTGPKTFDPGPTFNPGGNDPGPVLVNNQVTATFTVVDVSSVGDQNQHATLSPVSLNATGSDQTYGTITYTLDNTRPATSTTVVGINQGQEYPAQVDIYLPVEATVASQPEKVYRSIGELHLQSIVSAFNPFNGQDRFTLAQHVDFEDESNPGVVAFSVTDVNMN